MKKILVIMTCLVAFSFVNFAKGQNIEKVRDALIDNSRDGNNLDEMKALKYLRRVKDLSETKADVLVYLIEKSKYENNIDETEIFRRILRMDELNVHQARVLKAIIKRARTENGLDEGEAIKDIIRCENIDEDAADSLIRVVKKSRLRGIDENEVIEDILDEL